MATTEEKIYLVNVESNLDEYAADASKAADEVDRLTEENKALTTSGKASKQEIEKSNAALRAAKKEYTEAKKVVDLQTQANNANVNSRKQLNAIVALEQKRLGALADSYTINEKGVRELSKGYIEQSKRLKQAKEAVIQYDVAQKDGRSSVGLYSDAIQNSTDQFSAIPGPIGQAGAAISRYSKILLANPIVLIVTAIVAAIALLVKAFKSTDSGATELAVRMEQLNAIWDKIRLSLIKTIKWIIESRKRISEWKEGLDEAHPILGKVLKGLNLLLNPVTKVVGAIKILGKQLGITGEELDKVGKQARSFIEDMDNLRNAEQNYISESADNRRKIAQLDFISEDQTKTIEERGKALKELMSIALTELDARKAFAEEELRIEVENLAKRNGLRAEDVIAFTKMTDEEQASSSEALRTFRDNNEDKIVEVEELYAKLTDLDTNYFNTQKTFLAKLTGFTETDRKTKEAAAIKAQAALDKAIIEEEKRVEKQKVIDEKAAIKKQKDAETLAQWELNQELINEQNILELKELNNINLFDIERERLRIKYESEIRAAEKTGADVQLINEKYAKARIDIDEAQSDASLDLYGDFASNLATLFGENTAIGRTAAIAAATIDTYRGAQAAFAQTPGGIIIKSVAAAAAALIGLKNVKKIAAVKSGLPGDSGGGGSVPSSPTAISSTPSAQRVFASQTASSFTTQPQLSQSELNAATQGDILTSADIIDAISKLPAPIVTVEDINVKTEEKRKVDVRSTI